MSEGRFIADTLEAILVGMADSLRDAQTVLDSAPPTDSYGRPSSRYAIPHLDFEMTFELNTTETVQGGTRLVFKPVVNSETTKEITSTVKGRFVSLPPGDGLPLPVLGIDAVAESRTRKHLEIRATNTAGEPLAGVQLEVNLDIDSSKSLSGSSRAPKMSDVKLSDAAPVTDENGNAKVTIDLRNSLPNASQVVMSVDLGNERGLVVLNKAAGS